jgi:hypothetical protein
MNPQPTASTPTHSPQGMLFSAVLLPRKLPVYKRGPEDELPTTKH